MARSNLEFASVIFSGSRCSLTPALLTVDSKADVAGRAARSTNALHEMVNLQGQAKLIGAVSTPHGQWLREGRLSNSIRQDFCREKAKELPGS